MSKNAKVEVYRIILSPTNEKKKEFYSFKEFFIDKYVGLDEKSNDKKIFTKFFSEMFKPEDATYNENEKKRKAFRLSKDITKKEDTFVIHGVLEGGPYDVGKTTGNKKTKGDSKPLGRNIVVQDDFYFLLQTRLNEKVGILILQSYGSDKIDDVFLPFIKKLFKDVGKTFEAATPPYLPNSISELAKNTAIISELNYQTNNLIVNQISEDKKDKLSGKFNVKIIISPVNDGISIHSLPKWKKIINKTIFKFPENEMALESFNTKAGYLKSPSLKNPARFEIDQEKISIHPSIYLEKIDQVILNENGTPDWDSLKKYCNDDLLPELELEIYGKN
jgi:hypothetical protein